MMQGIININKDKGMTSHDVVSALRRILGLKRIGHTGTLDPMATGVLPVCIGKATRITEYISGSDKAYRAKLLLGTTTDTLDADGKILTTGAEIPSEALIRDAVLGFVGEISQIPPMYSAVKVGGKRLYSLARAGIEVKRNPRKVTIHSIDIIKIENDCVVLDVFCSKGTYIRTLAADIGEQLGCGAHLSALTRTKSGIFTIKSAVTLDTLRALTKSEISKNYIIPVDTLFMGFEPLIVNHENEKRIRNGAKIYYNAPSGTKFRVYAESGELLCLSVSEGDTLKMLKSFY